MRTIESILKKHDKEMDDLRKHANKIKQEILKETKLIINKHFNEHKTTN